MTPLERISLRVNRNGNLNDPTTPRPLLTLAEFFAGNDVVGSIGCNLDPTLTPAEFYTLLVRIASRADVTDVRVEVTMFDDPQWPFSDTVWIMTNASAQKVEEWFEAAVRPDACSVGWPEGIAMEPCPMPAGMHPVRCWWD